VGLPAPRGEIESDLVPGDMVWLEAGDRVPADLRVVEANDVAVDESALTGETEWVTKGEDPVPADAPRADRTSVLYMATSVRAGRGRGVVVVTGMATEVGRVAELAASTDTMQAPLQVGLERLGRTLSVVVVDLAAALAVQSWRRWAARYCRRTPERDKQATTEPSGWAR
jgi:P-type Ca2+ transporter type 2C